jgi:hypothetical protein
MTSDEKSVRRSRLYPPSSDEALALFNTFTVIEVRLRDGSVARVPFLRLNEFLAEHAGKGKSKGT